MGSQQDCGAGLELKDDAVWEIFLFSPLQLPKTSENSVPVSGCFMLFPWFGALAESFSISWVCEAWMLKDGDCARSPQDQLMAALSRIGGC